MKIKFIIFFIIFITPTFGETVDNFSNMCGVLGYKRFYAVPKSFTCSSGQFLPANAYQCVLCPDGYTCSGGTYTFDSKKAQGLERVSTQLSSNEHNTCAMNIGHIMNGYWTPNQYTCSAGYYLPANVDECRKCLNDHYCPGGTLIFNETTPQGLISCPENHPFAPAGMWQQSQCGRKLHIGDDILYMHQQPVNPTTHRLFVKYGNTIYSANTTLSDIQMSVSTARKLKVVLENNIYSVFDDSMEQNH